MNIEDLLNTIGINTVPYWLAMAIQEHNPRVALELAHSRVYKLDLVRLSDLWSN